MSESKKRLRDTVPLTATPYAERCQLVFFETAEVKRGIGYEQSYSAGCPVGMKDYRYSWGIRTVKEPDEEGFWF